MPTIAPDSAASVTQAFTISSLGPGWPASSHCRLDVSRVTTHTTLTTDSSGEQEDRRSRLDHHVPLFSSPFCRNNIRISSEQLRPKALFTTMWLPLLPLPATPPIERILPDRRVSFLDLPAELRNEVYTQALVQHDPIVLPYAYEKLSFYEPALLNATQWIRAEASPIYYGCNIFEAPSPPSAQKFLKHLSAANIASLRMFRPVDLVLPLSAQKRWYEALRTNLNRLVGECGKGALSRESVWVPVRRADGEADWMRVGEIDAFRVLDVEEGGWRLERRRGLGEEEM